MPSSNIAGEEKRPLVPKPRKAELFSIAEHDKDYFGKLAGFCQALFCKKVQKIKPTFTLQRS